jgi:transcriptional regulator with XRE-family HTH domain
MNIEKSIRICLAMNGMVMADLARELDISKPRVYKISANPTASLVEKIANVFNMKVSEFIALGEGK